MEPELREALRDISKKQDDQGERLARIEAKQDSTHNQITEHYQYRKDEIAPRLPVVDELKRQQDRHLDGHERWRIGASIAILGAWIKGFF